MLLYDHFTIKVSPKKIIPTEEYDNWKYQPPFFEGEISRYDIVPPLGTKCPFDILWGSYKHICMQKDLLYLWVER